MPTQDTIGKWYMSDNAIFADAFNFLLYDGEPVIRPEKLHEADTTGIALPYGNNARLTVQKYRDLKKIWAAKEDGEVVYILMGDELQSKVHYAMPVKDMLYDAIDYTEQVENARRSYQKKKDDAAGELSFENGDLRIRMTSEEFLSGFRKTDRLMPVITATIYFGADNWDGPLSLHDMMNVPDKRLLRAIPNYWINLIAPARIDDADFEKFNTDLGIAMKVLKYQNHGAERIIRGLNNRKVGRSTAEFLNVQAKLGLAFEEPKEEGEVDMCKAMETFIKSERKDERENTLLQSIKMMMKNAHFTLEQAFATLEVPAADQPRLAGLL